MQTKTLLYIPFILLTLESCAQGEGKDGNLPLKSFNDLTTEQVQEKLENYGLKGPLKSLEQRQHTTTKDSLTDLEGDDFVFHTSTVFEYDENGRLIRQLRNVYTYDKHGLKTETQGYKTGR